MIVIVAFIAGAVFGLKRARTKNGNRLDMAQYSAIYGIVFAIIGLFATIALDRMI
ncbi:MAG: hypothetical protein ACU0C9_09730 [Paracoccaceae bacterium]